MGRTAAAAAAAATAKPSTCSPNILKRALALAGALNPLSHLRLSLHHPPWALLEGHQALLRLGYDHTYHGWDIVYDDVDCYYSPGWVVLNMRRNVDAWERSLEATLVHANESWVLLDRQLARPPSASGPGTSISASSGPLLFRAPDGDMKAAIRGNARWIQREHANMIRGLVPKERLLEWYIKDGWEPLCKFLGKPVPDVPVPHANAVKGGWKAREEQANKGWIERAFLNLILLGIGLVIAILLARLYLF
ncbi:hypothetical protein VTG60DRAFT_7302 [Thermothelomyces hinnuleus]